MNAQVYYKKSRYNFFRNIIHNKMTNVYILIILVFLVFSGFTLKYLKIIKDPANNNKNNQPKTNPVEVVTEVASETETETKTQQEVVVEKNYEIRINKATNVLVVDEIGQDETKTFAKSFKCSVSDNVTLGEYNITDKSLWRQNSYNNYSQYSTRISESFLIKSIPFNGADKGKLLVNYYYNIGNSAYDNNSIYLLTGDAYWIYSNCNKNTKVVVYDDPSENVDYQFTYMPEIPWCITWDPTDPDTSSIWCPTLVDHFSGITNRVVDVNSYFNPLTDVYAYDVDGVDVSKYIHVDGLVDTTIPGDYLITYVIVDKSGHNIIWDSLVTVKGDISNDSNASINGLEEGMGINSPET